MAAKPLNTFLNVFLMSLGVSIITILLLLSTQFEERITKNAQGIDLVVGAKGSPLQLILSSIYHIDYPTGNIPLEEAQKIARNRMVKQALPMSLGDNYQGRRIVGTDTAYLSHFGMKIQEGRRWEKKMEAVIGAEVAETLGLGIGDEFHGAHGIGGGGHVHDYAAYTVVGIATPTGLIPDQLILTSLESVWHVHDSHDHDHDHDHDEDHKDHDHDNGVHQHGNNHDHDHDHKHDDQKETKKNKAVATSPSDDSDGEGMSFEEIQRLQKARAAAQAGNVRADDREITAMLITYRTPNAVIQFPRMVNQIGELQSASPAFETARLFNLIGIGVSLLQGLAYVIVLVAALSVFIALYNAMKERKYDLAIMRTMGASKGKLATLLMMEGAVLAFLGAAFGLILGHLTISLVTGFFSQTDTLGVDGQLFLVQELYLLIGAVVLGVISALIPAIQAYKIDISETLAEG